MAAVDVILAEQAINVRQSFTPDSKTFNGLTYILEGPAGALIDVTAATTHGEIIIASQDGKISHKGRLSIVFEGVGSADDMTPYSPYEHGNICHQRIKRQIGQMCPGTR